jgi:hypothetical protein
MGPGNSQTLYNIPKQNEVITEKNPISYTTMHDHLLGTSCCSLPSRQAATNTTFFTHTDEHRLVQKSLEHNLKTAADRKNMLLVVRQQFRYETLIS